MPWDREKAPSIIFMDEIDSIGGARGGGSRGDSEVQRTMLELLNQLDGFEPAQNIKVCRAPRHLLPRWQPVQWPVGLDAGAPVEAGADADLRGAVGLR